MDRDRTEVLFVEAKRLRTTLVEASAKLATFTQQLRDLLELSDDPDWEELTTQNAGRDKEDNDER